MCSMCLYAAHIVSLCNTYSVSTGCEQPKNMKSCPNQVRMAPFGLILSQNESYRVWKASGMPPGA